LEGEFRAWHSSLIDHSEEIAFYKGTQWEKDKINEAFDMIYNHAKNSYEKKFFMGILDSMSVKYGAFICGYIILGLPIFKRKSIDNKMTASTITKEYIKNSSLLINLAKVECVNC
jgi:ATP-binding cassette subfamily D (ALD) protein 3